MKTISRRVNITPNSNFRDQSTATRKAVPLYPTCGGLLRIDTEPHGLQSQKCVPSGPSRKSLADPCPTAPVLFVDSVQKLSHLKYIYLNMALPKYESYSSL